MQNLFSTTSFSESIWEIFQKLDLMSLIMCTMPFLESLVSGLKSLRIQSTLRFIRLFWNHCLWDETNEKKFCTKISHFHWGFRICYALFYSYYNFEYKTLFYTWWFLLISFGHEIAHSTCFRSIFWASDDGCNIFDLFVGKFFVGTFFCGDIFSKRDEKHIFS